jgi:hypothetical protein
MSRPIQTSDLIFPSQETTFSQTLASLKRSALSIPNRLRSIVEDADFVRSVAEAYNLPLIANERCGSWYIPPAEKASSAYFKSTDGHMGQWAFSQRRLNIQVLDVVGKYDGCIIVDSTRRGKSRLSFSLLLRVASLLICHVSQACPTLCLKLSPSGALFSMLSYFPVISSRINYILRHSASHLPNMHRFKPCLAAILSN